MKGKIHSLQSLGTVDGPGIRFVVFMQGCNLRCGCCHNPDTWEINGGTEYTPEQILQKVLRCKEYFGKTGGITISGGEPLLQSEFCYELFSLCHKEGVNTCLDTSGSVLNDGVKKLLTVTDRVLLDIKYTNDADYLEHVGCSIEKPLEFLAYLQTQKIPVTLRQVIIPTLTDNEENVVFLNGLAEKYSVVDKIELLPFRKICQTKYDNMGLQFKFGHLPEPTQDKMQELNKLIKSED
ncbi:MAG: pyruvate formate lyase-activating protein [Ruminococcaceae bacterium]|nr:pyruvate formate lyase-activating protein [Oscillospiraceae bacterium]